MVWFHECTHIRTFQPHAQAPLLVLRREMPGKEMEHEEVEVMRGGGEGEGGSC